MTGYRKSLNGDKYMLVSRDCHEPDLYCNFFDIIMLAKKIRVGNLICALHSLDQRHMNKSIFRENLKQATSSGLKVFLEFSDLSDTRQNNTQVIVSNGKIKLFYQWFSRSSEPELYKEALIADLPSRVVGDANKNLLLICGELGLLRVSHIDNSIRDEYKFLPWLKKNEISVVLNPAHTRFGRYELKIKQSAISSISDRCVLISTYNSDRKRSNSKVPWIAFAGGKNITGQIKELKTNLRADIRIGLFDRNGLFSKGKL